MSRCVGDVHAFADTIWGQRPAVWRADDSCCDDFRDVFSIAIADEMIRHAARRPTIRIVRDGANIDEARYTSSVRLGGRWVDLVDPDKLMECFAAGSSIVYQSLHRTCPTVHEFMTDLGHDVSHPAQVNAYLTPARATALAEHADEHDVIVLQLAGRKHWSVEGLGDIDVCVGDRVYIPRGVRHSAVSGDTISMHLTIGIIPTTYRSVMARRLADVDELDDALPLDFRRSDTETNFVEQISSRLATAAAAFSSLDPAAVADAERARRRPNGRPRGLDDLVALDSLSADSEIAWVKGHRLAPDTPGTDGRRLRITGGRRVVGVPVAVRGALDALMASPSVRVGDLPGLDDPSTVVVARRLVEEGVCTVERTADPQGSTSARGDRTA